ncbi:MAG: hypothetical protein ACREVR_10490 [Burkholderiales bacterium]
MASVNAYRFPIALGIYLAAGWVIGSGIYGSGWSHLVVMFLVFAFLLLYGALAFLVLKGSAVARLVLVALLAPLTHVVLLIIIGNPFNIGLAIQEGALLLVGAGIARLWQWLVLRKAGGHKNEA